MGIPKSTLRTTWKQAEKIKKSCRSATRMRAGKVTQIRMPIMENWKDAGSLD
jgi:hypothetical protein